jgi:hypothetical protein
MKTIDKSIVDYWRKDVNMRLVIEKSCKDMGSDICIKRLEGLKTIIDFYNVAHKDLIAKEMLEHKNQQEYEHFSNS